MYLGNTPATSFESVKKDRYTGLTGTSVTLSHAVSTVADIVVWINSVKQDYTSYSVNQTTLTVGGSLVASDIVEVAYLGRTFQTVNPPNASVGTSQLADNAVTTTKIIDANITSAKLASGVLPANTPSFSANKTSGSISFSLNTWSKMSFDNELYDTSSAYDTSNYRFTVPSGQAGKYHFTAHFNSYEQANSNISSWNTGLYKNGSLEIYLVQSELANHGSYRRNMIAADLDLAVGDYVELYARLNATAGTARVEVGNSFTRFSGYKLIG